MIRTMIKTRYYTKVCSIPLENVEQQLPTSSFAKRLQSNMLCYYGCILHLDTYSFGPCNVNALFTS